MAFKTFFIPSAIVLLCVGAIGGCASRVPVASAPSEIRDGIVHAARTYEVPGVAVAYISRGDVAWIDVHGLAGPGRPVTERTVFNVASLTKPLFATMVVYLADDGVFPLDAPLAAHWVDPDVRGDRRVDLLTPRLALSHQAGFPNWRGEAPLRFLFDPGMRHEYSGEGFEYVRRAVEAATGRSMGELMAEYVTGPADMADTFFGWESTISERLSEGFDETGSVIDQPSLAERAPNAAASTFSTVSDIAAFVAWVSRGADLMPEMFAEMATPQAVHADAVEDFSVGWRLITVDGNVVMSHDGREPGVRTQMFLDPARREGLVILTNSSNGELMTRPIVTAVWSDGDALLAQIDRDVWRFITSVPAAAQRPMIGFIAQSPSFTEKLLYAIDTVLVAPVSRSAEQRRRSKATIERFVVAHHRGDVDEESFARLLDRLAAPGISSFELVGRFSEDQAAEWVEGLANLTE